MAACCTNQKAGEHMLVKEDMVKQMAMRNHREGDLDPTIYDCKICKNRGYYWEVNVKKDKEGFIGYETLTECNCLTIRRRNIADKYGLDMQSVIIHYGDGEGCGYPGFDYRRL